MEKEFRYSERVLFREGDEMHISQGPYYPTKDGKKIKMGVSGKHYFSHVDEQGNVWVTNKKGMSKLVYMGEEKMSETTGTHLRPHKLRKIRKKKGT